MRGQLIMSEKERNRKYFLEQIKRGFMSIKEASKEMLLSYRQSRRLYQRYLEGGDQGIVHRSRGRMSNRRYSEEFRRKLINRYKERYLNFGPTFATEKLAEDGHKIHHDTLRRWLAEEGLWSKIRKVPKHRQRRIRKECFGEMVQIDGSHHRWFGQEEPEACLLNMVDDATGKTKSLMDKEETTHIILRTLKKWIEKYGIPVSVYVDLKNAYVGGPTRSLEDTEAIFVKVCRRLGIRIIKAYSAQAKGRVERNHAVYQDRLCKEIQLRKFKSIEEVNSYLVNTFTENLNKKFEKKAVNAQDAHREVPEDMNLDDIFCFEEERVVQADYAIRYKNRWIQLHQTKPIIVRPKRKVTVCVHLNNKLSIKYKGEKLKFSYIEEKQAKQINKKVSVKKSNAIKLDKTTSPWRQFNPDWLKSGRKVPEIIRHDVCL